MNKCLCCNKVLQKNQKKFCSITCSNYTRVGKKYGRKTWEKRICLTCNKEFEVVRHEKQKYCSRKCMDDRAKQILKCLNCNKEFEVRTKKTKRKYCSKNCAAEINSKRKIKNEIRKCIWCGKEFNVKPSMKKRYCSLRCAYDQNLGKKVFTNTKPQLRLEQILILLNFKVMKEVGFGGFYIDCYLPEYHLGLEADGDHWHSNIEAIKKDRARDDILLTKFKLLLLRLKESNIMNLFTEENIKKEILDFIKDNSSQLIERKNFSANLKIKSYVGNQYIGRIKGTILKKYLFVQFVV